MASPQESNSPCLKRKLVDDRLLKECKSRRVEDKNSPLFDSSTESCNSCCAHPDLANDCVNFLKSGVPSRIMYYKKGSWHNFPEQIMKSLVEQSRGNKSSVVAVMDNEPLLVDFLSMTLVNLKSRNQQSVAWFDDTDKCFFPSVFFDEEAGDAVNGEAVKFEGTAQGIILDKVASSPLEVVKQVVLQSCPRDPRKSCNADILRKKITYVKRGSKDFRFVQDLFLSGMGPFATPQNLLHVYRYSPNDITGHCRLEAFERQMRFTKQHGDANVRYGWLGCRKNDIIRILIDGLDATGKPVEKSGFNAGVYLSPENQAFTSVGFCDDDEKGVQYMLLCRVILGKREATELGSEDAFPSSEKYDSDVDDCLNPRCCVIGQSHLRTHIRFEYLISFKLAPVFRNHLLGLKGLWFHSPTKKVAADLCHKPVLSETGQGPTTPWISFKALFGGIQENISPVAMELLFHHYEELKERKITREEMVKKMMTIVGEKILLEALNKLQQCPSLWCKPSVEVSSEPATAATKQLSLDMAVRNSLIAPSGNHEHNSHAPRPSAPGRGNSPLISTEGCDSLSLSMLPKGHDTPASSEEPKCRESSSADRMSQTQSNHSQVQDAATKVHSAPTSRTMELNDQAPPCISQNKLPMPVCTRSRIIRATDILVALSTPREKSER